MDTVPIYVDNSSHIETVLMALIMQHPEIFVKEDYNENNRRNQNSR